MYYYSEKPENLEIQRKRSNTHDIELNCEKVKNFVFNSSQIKKLSSGSLIKKLVSKKKNRFALDGFNLDLTCKLFYGLLE